MMCRTQRLPLRPPSSILTRILNTLDSDRASLPLLSTRPLQVLVISLRISSVAINLQACCSDVIFVDVPGNAQTALQAAGRVLRIGQTRVCRIWVMCVDHSYDQTIQYRNTTKDAWDYFRTGTTERRQP